MARNGRQSLGAENDPFDNSQQELDYANDLDRDSSLKPLDKNSAQPTPCVQPWEILSPNPLKL